MNPLDHRRRTAVLAPLRRLRRALALLRQRADRGSRLRGAAAGLPTGLRRPVRRDRYGRRRIFLTGMALTVIGAAIAALAADGT
jgi:hypothetical protein